MQGCLAWSSTDDASIVSMNNKGISYLHLYALWNGKVDEVTVSQVEDKLTLCKTGPVPNTL